MKRRKKPSWQNQRWFLGFLALVAVGTSVVFAMVVFALRTEPFPVQEELQPAAVRSFPSVSQRWQPLTLLAVGDIMLGRTVESLMRRNGDDYPFALADAMLQGHDMVFGNLEGPIVEQHVPTLPQSLRFSFASGVASVLKRYHFSVLSLANNHGLDQGEAGVRSTVSFLTDAGIAAVGSPNGFPQERIVTATANGRTIHMLAFNELQPSFPTEEGLTKIAEAAADPEAFVVVSVHWGNEYQLHSNGHQQTLAHAMVDQGADLILGHHPHVVQELEQYKDALVVYSLGNFIFDQYFSKDTQEALALAAEIRDENVRYRLLPLVSVRSQPQPMPTERTATWLRQLADRSDPRLSAAIQQGTIALPW